LNCLAQFGRDTALLIAIAFGISIGILHSADEKSPSPNPVPVPSAPLDLQTSFELAVLHSETLGMKEEDVRVAQARYWQAIGAALPKVHLLATQRWQNSSGSSSGLTSSTGINTDSNNSGGTDRFESRIQVRQPIFSGFRDINIASATKADTEARKHDKQRAYQLLYLDVADVFYQILLYEEDLGILKELEKATKDRVADLEHRVELGKSRSGDLLSSKSQMGMIGVTVAQVNGLLQSTKELFAFLTGIPAPEIRLKDSLKLPSVESLETYLKETGERPDVLAAISEERAARKRLSAAKGEHWGTISAEGNYYLKENPASNREWNILLTADIPLFEGGIIEARIRENRALARSSELNLDQLRRTADMEVRRAYSEFLSSAAQLAHLSETVNVSAENYKIQSEDFKLGITSNLEVLDSLKTLLETRRQRLSTEIDAHITLIRLFVAAGKVQK
jgi:outer membrane protein